MGRDHPATPGLEEATRCRDQAAANRFLLEHPLDRYCGLTASLTAEVTEQPEWTGHDGGPFGIVHFRSDQVFGRRLVKSQVSLAESEMPLSPVRLDPKGRFQPVSHEVQVGQG